MSAVRHIFSHYGADPILGIRLGVNVCSKLNALPPSRALSPRGAILKRAAEVAVVRHKSGGIGPATLTLILEDLEVAVREKAGELDADTLKSLIRGGGTAQAAVEKERNQIARTRYAETKAQKLAAAEAKKAEARAKREARKAATQTA